ncbi:K+-channel ERG-like protein [Zymoseptoria tritici IPO323]|uniref:K+-channel ERG-like protein n=1 Tax=Zymoseptoria tritici (strain CBS 115943 / IPO323) TaxID=336722 RepID=F9X1M6_ZYMTI|nr:K+-channel ERG-like protein [Zymoseptoria tritici IPO323]EGP91840.1 K+-channel ERG-like protein [Zymoseptoria tritici IPO323]
MSIKPSPAPPNGFDLEQESFATPNNHLLSNEPQQEYSAISGDIQDEDFDLGSFDLKPPPAPDFVQNGLEVLMDRVHSTDHLDIILSDPKLSINFFRFVENYHPGHLESIKQYSSARKALAALDFANALASQIPSTSSSAPYIAANLDPRFEAKVQRMTAEVLEDVLPAYVTFRLVRLATDSLVKEITGTGSPVMRTLIPDLATVYCISDPNMLDNPIVYASEEFHSTSLYSPSQALNRNCRFLQGPNTSPASVRRLVAAITAGQELCETILNYRRDGSPFVNLLMIAPLYDNKGKVRYYLGAQIDVSGLIEEGKGLESLATLLSRDQDADGKSNNDPTAPKDPDVALSALAAPSGNHLSSMSSRDRSTDLLSTPNTAHSRNNPNSRQRIVLTEQPEPQLYSGPNLGPSGRLPGVYQNYLLVRPYPSLRITFLSPSLRIPGLLQSAFLDRIAGPESIREGLLDAFSRGIGVTAKILWNSSSSPRWIHCTPLNGSDGKVGVWMVVMVEDENVTGGLKRTGTVAPAINPAQSRTVGEAMGDSRGKGVRESASVRDMAENMTADSRRLYAEYLRGGSRARGGAGGAQQETDAVPGATAVSRGADGTPTTTTRIRNVKDVFRGF